MTLSFGSVIYFYYLSTITLKHKNHETIDRKTILFNVRINTKHIGW